ncbi:hypothetical protein EHS39_25030 [Ensifer sp. MPMI2T]|nr:hypothetical protein EHS39_25030 [Ensifer sp. MPMI2T]
MRLLHDSLNRNRFRDKIMQQFKMLQRLCASNWTRGAVEIALAPSRRIFRPARDKSFEPPRAYMYPHPIAKFSPSGVTGL